MRNFWIFLLAASVCACAARTPVDGSIAEITDDGAAFLAEIYPPAKTRLTLTASDDFGRDLAAKLRERGYAVSETNIRDVRDGLPMRCVVATDTDGEIFAVYYVGEEILSRGYAPNVAAKKYAPITAWSRRQPAAAKE